MGLSIPAEARTDDDLGRPGRIWARIHHKVTWFVAETANSLALPQPQQYSTKIWRSRSKYKSGAENMGSLPGTDGADAILR